jgi:hypothetical protein
MEVREALARLDDIHDQLTKAEVYRGFQTVAIGLTGLVGLAAAALQPLVIEPQEPAQFVFYWVKIAAGCAVIGAGRSIYDYLVHEDEFAQRRTRQVMAQFLPCVVAGGAVTLLFQREGLQLVPFLPGLWAMFFGLGNIAARPYLPRAISVIGLFYLSAGTFLLWRATGTNDLSGWSVGGVFGLGHLATAWVLYQHQEISSHV